MGLPEINRSRIEKLESRLDSLAITPPTSVFNNVEITNTLTLKSGNDINSSSKLSAFSASGRSALLIRAKSDMNDGAGINLYGNDDSTYPGQFYISTGGFTRLHILQNGKIGIGTANPSVALDVIGDISSSGAVNSSTIRAVSSQDVSYTSTTHGFQVGDSSTTNIRLDGDEILAANNGSPSVLNINTGGGAVKIGAGLMSRSDPSLEVWGEVTIHGQGMSGLNLTGIDHTYIEFYAKYGSGNTNRSGYFGFSSGLSNNMAIGNELTDGGITFVTSGTGAVTIGTQKVWHQGMTAAGKVQAPSTLNGVATASVSFGKTFPSPPIVSVTVDASSPQTADISVSNVTTTGFTCSFYRTTSSDTVFHWIAMLPN